MNKLIQILVLVFSLAAAVSVIWLISKSQRPTVDGALQVLVDEDQYWRKIKSGDVEAGLKLYDAYLFEAPSQTKRQEEILRELLATRDKRIQFSLGVKIINECMTLRRNGKPLDLNREKEGIELLAQAAAQGDKEAANTLEMYERFSKR